jgi:hypothetical protein
MGMHGARRVAACGLCHTARCESKVTKYSVGPPPKKKKLSSGGVRAAHPGLQAELQYVGDASEVAGSARVSLASHSGLRGRRHMAAKAAKALEAARQLSGRAQLLMQRVGDHGTQDGRKGHRDSRRGHALPCAMRMCASCHRRTDVSGLFIRSPKYLLIG